jgi:hypothetical protein
MSRLRDNRAVSWFQAHWRTIGIAAAGVIVLFGVVGYFAIPAAVRWGIETVASRELGRSVTVEKVSANPYSLRVTMNGLAIAGHPGEAPLLTVRQATVNASLMSALRLVPVIDALSIDGLAAHLIRLEAQRFNFSDIIERLRARPKTSDEPTPFAIYNIEVTNSAIDLDDRVLKSRHALTDIALGIPFISSLDTHSEVTVQPAFAARIDGTPIELKGETRPFHQTLESSISLKLDDLDIPKYLSYSPVKLNFEVGSGTPTPTRESRSGARLRARGQPATPRNCSSRIDRCQRPGNGSPGRVDGAAADRMEVAPGRDRRDRAARRPRRDRRCRAHRTSRPARTRCLGSDQLGALPAAATDKPGAGR